MPSFSRRQPCPVHEVQPQCTCEPVTPHRPQRYLTRDEKRKMKNWPDWAGLDIQVTVDASIPIGSIKDFYELG